MFRRAVVFVVAMLVAACVGHDAPIPARPASDPRASIAVEPTEPVAPSPARPPAAPTATDAAAKPAAVVPPPPRKRGPRSAVPAAPADASGGSFHITGRVLAEDGAPMAGIDVTVARRRDVRVGAWSRDLSDPADAVARATTDAEGRFDVPVAGDGPWIAAARAPGCADAVCEVWTDGTVPSLRLAAAPETTLTVRRAADRTPVEGAEVRVLGEWFAGVTRVRVVTGPDGRARARFVPGDSVVVSGPDLVTALLYDAPRTDTDVLLERGHRLAGVVRDRAGRPVAGARVIPERPDRAPCLSGPDGRFATDGVPANGRLLDAFAAGFVPWQGDVAPGDEAVTVVLSRPSFVEGRIVGRDGAPTRGHVTYAGLIPLSEGSWGSPDAPTDADGRFRLGPIPSGTVKLYAFGADAGAGAATRTVLTCDVPDGGTLGGVVARLGDLFPSCVVLRVRDESGAPVTQPAVSAGATCQFSWEGDLTVVRLPAPPGTLVSLTVSTAPPLAHTPVRVVAETSATRAAAEAAPVEVRFPARRAIWVRVQGPDGDAFSDDAAPAVALFEGPPWTPIATAAQSGADAHATVVLATVAPERRTLVTVEAPGCARVRRLLTPDEFAAGRATVRLVRGVAVTGRLVSGDPRAPAGAVVGLACPDDADPWVADVRIPDVRGDDGTFRFDRVPPGRAQITVLWPGLPVAERRIDVGDADLALGAIDVPASATVRGAVRRADGSPCGGATIDVCRTAESVPLAAISRGDGAFEVDVPGDGRCALVVRAADAGARVVRLDGTDLARPLDVVLARESRIDLSVRLPRDRPASWWVRLATDDGAARWDADLVRDDDLGGLDQHGVLRGVGAGRLVVTVTGGGEGWEASRTIDVAEGVDAAAIVGER